MTSRPERRSDPQWAEERRAESYLLSVLCQIGHERDLRYKKQLLEILRKVNAGKLEPQQILSEADRLLATWQNRSTS